MRGLCQIVRFNWPYYAAAAATLLAIELVSRYLPDGNFWRTSLRSGTALASLWIVATLAASWIIYDWSPLATWQWIRDALGFRPRAWLNIHAGFDESTPAVRDLLSPSHGRV